MSNIIELKFKPIAGDLYDVEFKGESPKKTISATVPAFDPQYYQKYQQACHQYQKTRLGLKQKPSVVNQADLERNRQQVRTSATELLESFNRWSQSPEFAEIAQAIADRSENLNVTICTVCQQLRQLPFHESLLFPQGVEVVFSAIAAEELERTTRHPDKIRILVILGDTTGINIEEDKKAIEQYCGEDAKTVFLPQPDRQTLIDNLADTEGWDIIFFSGHSDSEGGTGRIYINLTDSLTMDELKDVLKPAIEQRVQIAIFNSCDGLGIASELERLNIDRLIVMREPIPDPVAQAFLKNFLRAFTRGAGFDDAVKVARQQLEVLEDEYPTASWLPIVIQNRFVPAPTWQSLGKIKTALRPCSAHYRDVGRYVEIGDRATS